MSTQKTSKPNLSVIAVEVEAFPIPTPKFTKNSVNGEGDDNA